jgi:hypothetical protein
LGSPGLLLWRSTSVAFTTNRETNIASTTLRRCTRGIAAVGVDDFAIEAGFGYALHVVVAHHDLKEILRAVIVEQLT